MEKLLTKFVSAIFHPMLFPTYYVVIIFNLHFGFSFMIPVKGRWMVTGLVFITTYAVPILVTEMLGWNFKRLFYTDAKDKRLLLLASSVIFYLTTYYLLTRLQLSPMFSVFILGSTSLLVLGIIISAIWNISFYMIASGALFGAFLCVAIILKTDLLLLLLTLIFLAGFLGYSRLKNSAHTPLQVYSGFLLGTVTMYLHFLYF